MTSSFLVACLIAFISYHAHNFVTAIKDITRRNKISQDMLAKKMQEEQQEKQNAIAKEMEENASEFKYRTNSIISRCESNRDSAKKIVLKDDSKSIELQKEVWNLLDDISINIQILENAVEEINAKGNT